MSSAVEMMGISRRFGAVAALDQVQLSVQSQEIHAVVGENGAGKTTLMKILYGAERADSGTVRVNGKDVSFRNSAEAIAAGIGMVSQHYSIIPELTCLENLMLGAEGGPIIHARDAAKRATELADRMGFSFDWFALAEQLSPAGAQKLEILKLLWRNAQIMILDEPTAMLSPADSDALYESLKKLTREGTTVLVVTHRIAEILEHAQTVTVLRSGKWITTRPVEGLTASETAELIVGRAVSTGRLREAFRTQEHALQVSGLSVRGHRGDLAVNAASFSVGKGEILGIAGVDGSGQRELVWSLCGLVRAESGSIHFRNSDWTRASAAERLAGGLRLIPEDRHEEGVVDDWSLTENAAIGLQRDPLLTSGSWMNSSAVASLSERAAERFATKHGGLSQPMSSLSGGNQQRFVAARALELNPGLVIAFQPARGLDIDATRNVYKGLLEVAESGASVIIVGFDLDELLEFCDRIVVMRQGQVFEPDEANRLSRAEIGKLMVGAA